MHGFLQICCKTQKAVSVTNYSKAHRQKMTIDIVELEIYKKTEE